MDHLQAIAFESSANDSVTNWDKSKEKLKKVEEQKKVGNREQDFIERISPWNRPEKAEPTNIKQDS